MLMLVKQRSWYENREEEELKVNITAEFPLWGIP